jgi:hypothetical protein
VRIATALIPLLALQFAPSVAALKLEADVVVLDRDIILARSPSGPGEDIILVADTLVVLPGVVLRAGDGASAAAAVGEGMVEAESGAPGGSIIVRAHIVRFEGLALGGAGGHGGDATASGTRAWARGGDGGDGGTVHGVPEGRWSAGEGGHGGDALADADDAPECAYDGADARGHGDGALVAGDGHESNVTAEDGGTACGPGSPGGSGGWAYALGGDAGGTGLQAGRPGDAFAGGGDGARGGDACVSTALGGGAGGDGGWAFAEGGDIDQGATLDDAASKGGSALAVGGRGADGGRGIAGKEGPHGSGGLGDAVGGTAEGTRIAAIAEGEAVFQLGADGSDEETCAASTAFMVPAPGGATIGLALVATALVARRANRKRS